MILFSVLIYAVASTLLLMSAVLAIEICAAIWAPDPETKACQAETRNALAVLVPAHNEEASIGPVLDAVKTQLGPDDRLLVVADNCSDNTPEIACTHGAEVIVRTDAIRRGKGYALQFGIEHLGHDPRPTVIIIDADCLAAADAIDVLWQTATKTNRPVQSLYLMETDASSPLHQKISAFAFKVKNFVRFEGLRRLGFGCPLAGTGMAFPWHVIENAKLASGNIVEDMKLGIDLAIAGHPTVFEPRARVTSQFPDGDTNQDTQRQRWEHGHVRTIVSECPRLLVQAVLQRRADLLVVAADLLVLPLSLHAMLSAAMLVVAGFVALLTGDWTALIMLILTAGILVSSILAAWFFYGRQLLTVHQILQIPVYLLNKIPIYLRLLYRPEREWKRSARKNEDQTR